MKSQHPDYYGENPLEISCTQGSDTTQGSVRVTQYAASMSLFHSMSSAQAREMASALIAAADLAEGDRK